ncbi:vancomycin resistance protein YoaR [Nocardioides ginsengisegetis]|uniref:Vancomycin resistance protein YoaR n=1 Tax=Nocardioides ginsengisegetis TaxID=661491 RepID=A0A7W3PAH5_9ACTN|nr:VanW family protein [Nocardioides ginsengisegetis]MBA8804491.1 vancomycin resistance protein YoaR [Nocardioides ginsengisegetis]
MDQERESEGGKVVLVMLLVLVLLVAGGYAAAYAFAGNKLPQGAEIAGVRVGGLRPVVAEQTLRDGLADRVDAPITVTVGGQPVELVPSQIGLGVDYAASVAAAGGERSWRPSHLWDYYTAGGDHAPELAVDTAALTQAMTNLAATTGHHPVDGTVSFKDGKIVTTSARPGLAIDPQEAAQQVEDAYLTELADEGVEVALHQVQPDVDNADVQKALDSFANPALSSAVTLDFGDASIRLQPRDYADALALEPHDGRLEPTVDEKKLIKLVDRAISDHGAPVPATVALVNGRPRVIPDKPGVTFHPSDVTDAFLSLVTRPDGKREMKVKATVARAAFTTKDARKLGIKQQISTFTTYYPYAEYRNVNIGRAAELVDGTVLKPGQTFSLNKTVGERTRANGFTEGFIISNGIFAEDLGGGVSQMATTTFNAMFFAGLKDVEHKPHSFYIDRYPVGREATVAWGSVDLRFTNDTPYGVLISAHVTPSTPTSQGVVTVSMWSTKVWDITTTTGDRYHFVPPKTRTLHTKDCYPNEGYDGFDIDVVRYFRKVGQSALDHQETFHTHYIPSDTVICK